MKNTFSRESAFPLTELVGFIDSPRKKALKRFCEACSSLEVPLREIDIRIIKIPKNVTKWRECGWEKTYREEVLQFISTFDNRGHSVLASHIYYYHTDQELKNLFRRQFYREDVSPEVMFDD